ncbi:MAG: hypothetical protein QXE78_07740 [Nitrososphaeria archaeon]
MSLPKFKTAKDLVVEAIGECPKHIILLLRENLPNEISSNDIKILYPENLEKKLNSCGIDILDFYILLEFGNKKFLQGNIEDDIMLYVYKLD